MKPRVGLLVSFAPLEVGSEKAPELLGRARELFSKLDVELCVAEEPVHDTATAVATAERFTKAGVDAVCWVAACWSFDHVAIDLVRRCPVPLIAWGLPGIHTGSLCFSQQLVSVLTELGHPRQFVFGDLTDERPQAEMLACARSAAVVRRLRLARLGMLGHRTVGMTEVTGHEYDIAEVFGPTVLYIGVHEFLRARDAVPPDDARLLWAEIRQRAGRCAVEADVGVRSMQAYLAMKQWAERESLAGIAVGCYPDLMGEVCLGCGLLAEDGIVTACEGDLNSTILTYYMHHLAGEPVHNTDLLDVNEQDRTMVLSHCGNSAICLAAGKDQIALESVRLMGQGVVSQYPGRPGPVTFANLCGRKGTYRLTYGRAEAVATEMVFPGIPMKLRIDTPIDEFLSRTADFGTGHHWMIAYGDLTRPLAHAASLLDIDALPLA